MHTYKIGSVNLIKRVSASLLGAAVALCLTAANLAAAQATVDLGQAAHFAVLAHTTVTNTGNTKINGDLGVDPGTAVVGFFPVDGGPGVVNGTIYTPTTICPNNKACFAQPNNVAASGQASLLVAYNDAAGRTVAPVDITGIDQGGKTLAPGLYKSTSGIAITGDLTLAGNGIYIFQSATTLTVNIASRVVLSGGAKAADVFWQVGSSATLFTTAAVAGNILAHDSITLQTGATLNGRALALNAAVTLDTNTVTIPTLGSTLGSTGPCEALDDTCAAVDNTFTFSSVMVSLKSPTVGSLTCSGTTKTLPAKTTKCDGEKLGGAFPETAPTQPCSMTLGSTTLTTDDWTETISKAGKVKLTCKFGGTDTK